MNKWLHYSLWVIIFLLLSYGFSINKAHGETIVEPSIDNVVSWRKDQSLGLVLMYRIDGRDVFFSHPLKSEGQYSECKELQFKPKYNEIHIIIGGVRPWLYIVSADSTAYRFKNSAIWKMSNLTKTLWQKPYKHIDKE